MFETRFSHSSATVIPPNLSIEHAISILHDFETVIKLSPDTRGCRPVPPKDARAKTNAKTNDTIHLDLQFYEVEDDLPFIPKRLWSGGVRYRADFLPVGDGCDITIYAPGGFTSTNHWRLVRDHLPGIEEGREGLDRTQSKDLFHAHDTGSGWYVQIVSDAVCSKTYAAFVKGFLRNTHLVLERNFIEKLRATQPQQDQPQLRPQRMRRPTLGRRKSSVL